ncbi:Ig-like domain-containing protein [Mangrovicoccus ximenensis]|uniref:Ig-like domain-containing protein n=1 Tax=Mangrovicoccus ximenensis TaxID=1911570 RepID=UPI000D396D98|nr:Ig-like domain-containing protein [Mangrovicoccus ximenensis]
MPYDLPGGGRVTLTAAGSLSFDTDGDFDLAAGATQDVTFSYVLRDGGGLDSTATVTITVTGNGAAPAATDDTVATDEDTAVQANLVQGLGGAAADSDPDGDPLHVSAVNGAAADVGVQVTLPSGALLTVLTGGAMFYDPNGAFEHLGEGDTGRDSFDYEVSDGAGGTDTATVTLEIAGANDAPVARDDRVQTGEDTVLGGDVTADNGNGADSDADGDALRVIRVNGAGFVPGTPLLLASGALLTMNADGTFSYDPNGAFEALKSTESASDLFGYTVEDPSGAVSTAILRITVQGANDAPDAADDTGAAFENTLATGNVLGNDTDPDGDLLTVSSVGGQAVGAPVALASGALVTVNADGSYSYDPNGAFDALAPGEEATDSFAYTASDGAAGDGATVVITITGKGVDPVATDNAYATDEETAVVGNVLADDTGAGVDSDADGEALAVTHVEGRPIADGPVTLVSGAVVSMNPDGTFSYDPAGALDGIRAGGTRLDTFTYAVADPFGGTDTAGVFVTVSGVNDDPAPRDDAFETFETAVLEGGVLGNDADIDGDALEVSGVNGAAFTPGAAIELPSGALLAMNADGTFSYDPNGAFDALVFGQTATDSFAYTVDDGNGGMAEATAGITVESTDGAPNLVATAGAFAGGRSSQWLSVSYRVDNEGGATAAGKNWVDRLYLSTDQVLDEDDIFLRELSFSGQLDTGEWYGKTATVKMPGVPGDYYLLVDVDAKNAQIETGEADNVGASRDPGTLLAAYTSTLTAVSISDPTLGVTEAVTGQSFLLRGQAVDFVTNEGEPYAVVKIVAEIGGFARTATVLTDVDGYWSASFSTLPGEAGLLSLTARHPDDPTEAPIPDDTVMVYGMGFERADNFRTLEVIEGTAGTFSFTLENFGEFDLSGLEAELLDLPAAWSGAVSLGTELGGDGSIELELTVDVPGGTPLAFDDMQVRVTSDEGASALLDVRIDPVVSLADIEIVQATVRAFAIREDQTFVSFDVVNNGSTVSNAISVDIPALDWIGFVSPEILDPLMPGESATVTLVLSPDAEDPLGRFAGSIGVAEDGGDIDTVGFEFFTVSDALGTLDITLTDELYYFAEGEPLVQDGKVTVRNASTGEIVFQSDDVDGSVTIEDIPEGTYTVRVQAKDHDLFQANVKVEPGQANEVEAFMSRQTVKYYWSVEEIEIEDRYEVTIEADFETDVPVPVVVLDPPVLDFAPLDDIGDTQTFELTVTNHGLIGVNDLALQLGSHPFFEISTPFDSLDFLDAKSSVTIPVKVTRIDDFDTATAPLGAEAFSLASVAAATAETIPCSWSGTLTYEFPCGDNDVEKSISLSGSNVPGNCGQGGSGGFGFGGGGGGGGGGGFGGGGGGGGSSYSSSVPMISEQKLCDLLKVIFDCEDLVPQGPLMGGIMDGLEYLATGNAEGWVETVQDVFNFFDDPVGTLEDKIAGQNPFSGFAGASAMMLVSGTKETSDPVPLAEVSGTRESSGDAGELLHLHGAEATSLAASTGGKKVTAGGIAGALGTASSVGACVSAVGNFIENETVKDVGDTIKDVADKSKPVFDFLSKFEGGGDSPSASGALFAGAAVQLAADGEPFDPATVQRVVDALAAFEAVAAGAETSGDVVALEPEVDEVIDALRDLKIALEAHPEEDPPEALFDAIDGLRDSFEALETRIDTIQPHLGELGIARAAIAEIQDFWGAVFGDQIWLDNIDDVDTVAFLDEVSRLSKLNTAIGGRLTADNIAALMAMPLAEGLQGAAAQEFLDRWNRSLDNYEAGIFGTDDPGAGSLPFIAFDKIDLARQALSARWEEAWDAGYDSISDYVNALITSVETGLNQETEGSVCATVRMQISQEVVLTRQAFEAKLEIVNETANELTDIYVTVFIRDETGALVAQNTFGVTDPELEGLTAVDGTGVIAANSSGSASFTLIPSRLAAAEEETTYYVTGQLSYSEQGETLTFPLREEEITVRPQAELELDYYLQRNVYGDNPFTEEVEPSDPFALGLMVTNNGAGEANNLTITSAQPKIIENEKGLLIDFEIIGSSVNGEDFSPSLLADFGDVAAGGREVATWFMQSSLEGKFVDYEVSFKHLNSLGIEELSLITETRIHELVQVVKSDLTGDDGLTDFLINSDWEQDPAGIPDQLHTTDGGIYDVAQAVREEISGTVSGGSLSVILSADMDAGWNYASVLDPGRGNYRVESITRNSDGKDILLENFWQTDRTFPANGTPIREDVLHLLDHVAEEGVQTYTVVYAPNNLLPVAAADFATTLEDTSVRIAVLDNDSDPEGQALSVATISQPVNGTVTLGTGGVLTYIPDLNFSGTDTFSYFVSDGQDTAEGRVTVTVEEDEDPDSSVRIDVTLAEPAGAAPVSPEISAGEGNSGEKDVWFTVSRIGDLTGPVTVDLAAGGTLAAADLTGSIPASVTLAAGQSKASFRVKLKGDYAVEEDETLTATITGTDRPDVTIEPDGNAAVFTALNDDVAGVVKVFASLSQPAATPSGAPEDTSAAEGDDGTTPVWFTVLREGNLAGAVTVSLARFGSATSADVTGTVPASVTLADGQAFTWFRLDVKGDVAAEPDDTLGVRITGTNRVDLVPFSDPDVQHVILNDEETNQRPSAVDDTFSMRPGGTLAIAAPGVLANDSDADGDALQVVSFVQASNGTVTMRADGGFDYEPDPGFVGTDTFSYTMTDGFAYSQATVSVAVENAAPEFLSASAFAVGENTVFVGRLEATDPDDPDGEIVFAISGGADAALFALDPLTDELVFREAPDWETPQDAGGDNVHDLRVSATSNGETVYADLQITVENVFERDTVQTGGGGTDVLIGGETEDEISTGGGFGDVAIGGGGMDVFIFENAADGRTQMATISDYQPGVDAIDLQGTAVDFHFSWNGSTYLYMNGSDYDGLTVNGAPSLADITFI